MKANVEANIKIPAPKDVTGGREKGQKVGILDTPNCGKADSIGAPKDVTENQFSKKDLNLNSTNPGKVDKV